MADILDIVDLASVQDGIGVPESKLGLLASYVTTVSRHIDDLCGPVVVRTVTAETHHGGACNVVLKKRPVSSITAVTESGVAVTDYHLDAEAGILERMGAASTYTGYYWLTGRWNVSVTYVAGRYATTSVVDTLFRQAAIMTAQYMWMCEQGGGGNATFGAYEGEVVHVPGTNYVLPKSAFMLLRPYIQAKAGVA